MTALQASLFLRSLLASKYRITWAALAAGDVGSGDLNKAAICTVIAQRQLPRGRQEVVAARARGLKDLVGRALHPDPGKVVLSRRTLILFVRAFDMSTPDGKRLEALLASRGAARPLDTETGRIHNPLRPAYETVAVVEEHEIGPDRFPVSHQTTQTIRALEDGVTSHLYAFDASALTVDVLEGGRPRGGPAIKVAEGWYGVEIDLARRLHRGSTTTIKYVSRFNYSTLPPAEFRRGASGRIHSVAIRVKFAASMTPARIYAAEWDSPQSPPTNSQAVLAVDHVVERFENRVEGGLVGFWWVWE